MVQVPLEQRTGNENMIPAGVLYEPSEKTPIETQVSYLKYVINFQFFIHAIYDSFNLNELNNE